MTRAELSRARAQRWRSVVEEHKRSGKRDVEFCQERGVGVHSLRAWRYRFAREEARRVRSASRRRRRIPSTIDFVPVRVQETGTRSQVAAVPMPADGSASGVELVLWRDRVVRVHRGFDEATLVRVVAHLESR